MITEPIFPEVPDFGWFSPPPKMVYPQTRMENQEILSQPVWWKEIVRIVKQIFIWIECYVDLSIDPSSWLITVLDAPRGPPDEFMEYFGAANAFGWKVVH